MIYKPPFPPGWPWKPPFPTGWPIPPEMPFPRFPLPGKLEKLGKIGGAAAMLAYGAWLLWKKRQTQKEKNMPTNGAPMSGAAKSTARSGTARQGDRTGEPFPLGTMQSLESESIALKSVSITGDVQGLLFSSTVSQEYVNETDKALEVIYTFPLGWDTALLGLTATIGEKRLTGEVVKKAEAEEKYEEAVKDGDCAIMVQQSSRGLYTANLGNIKPGEKVVVELHCARLLRFEQGQVRLAIPTVIGARYGDPYGPGGLAPHESAMVDARARYPFRLRLHILGDMARADISCPSHEVFMHPFLGGVIVSLKEGAALDRDFILLLRGLEAHSHALSVADGEGVMVAASFAHELPQKTVAPIGLKILVDCSGSMSGSSIAEAQKGLGKVLALLQPADQVSYSRFGSEVEHLAPRLLACTPETVEKLSQAIDATSADMGGTEMETALSSTFKIAGSHGEEVPPLVLLITDGDVWDVKNIIATAKASGHRIFTIGVGSAPAESLLRDMAEQTGGACEFVSPKENMADAIVRMFHRMRGAIAKNIRIQWGQVPVWESKLPRYIYDGETVHAFALLREEPASGPVLSWEQDGQTQSAACGNVEAASEGEDLLRLGRRCQMEEAASAEEKLALALKYQLVSELTSLILVHERPEGEKSEGLPAIQQMPQMPAHGHGCNSFLGAGMMECCFAMNPRRMFGGWGPDAVVMEDPGGPESVSSLEYFTQMMTLDELGPGVFASKQELLEYVLLQWHRNVLSVTTMKEFMERLFASEKGAALEFYFERLDDNSILEPEQNMAVFLQWASDKLNPGQTPDRQAQRLLTATMQDADTVMAEMMPEFLDAWYANS